MPTLTVNTNVPQSQIPAGLAAALSKTVAKSLAKPESYVAIQLNGGQHIMWGGSSEPAALCTLASIGQISRERNKESSKAIQTVLESQLGVSVSRQYLTFVDLKKENVGFQATTFDALM